MNFYESARTNYHDMLEMTVPCRKNHLEKSPDSTAHSKKAEALAKRLDTILFREASSLHEYADVYTLESRMNALLTHVLGRCIQRAASQEHSSRERALRTILGKDRLRKVVKLVRTIKRMRLVPNATNDVAAATNGVVSPPPRSSDIGLTAMHKPVRDLFLNTPIVSVFELASPENFINVPWDELIAQGNKVVEDCRVWIQQAKQQADSIPLTNSNIVSPTDDLKAAAGEIADPFGPQCLL